MFTLLKVVNLKTYKIFQKRKKQANVYRYKILMMNKAELLQELIDYHELYLLDPFDISVTIRGQHLMDVLIQRTELIELQDLSHELQAKLQQRLNAQLQQASTAP